MKYSVHALLDKEIDLTECVYFCYMRCMFSYCLAEGHVPHGSNRIDDAGQYTAGNNLFYYIFFF